MIAVRTIALKSNVSQNTSKSKKDPSKRSGKEEEEAGVGEETKDASPVNTANSKNNDEKTRVEKNNEREESSSLTQIFEIISKLRLTLDKTINIVFASPTSPLPSLKDQGTYPIEIIEKIDIGLSEWRDEPNDVRYIITLYGDKIAFDDVITFISAIIEDYRRESRLSLTAIKEPKTKSIYRGDLVYNPDSMGFPYLELRDGLLDDRYRIVLNQLLAGAIVPNIPNHFVRSRVFDYPPRALTRQNIITHAIGNSGVINNACY